MTPKTHEIRAISLTQKDYAAYGDVIAARSDVSPVSANMGTAARFNSLTKLENLRPGKSEANVCVYHCEPQIVRPVDQFMVRVLERHFFSTQTFVPMNASRYLVIVCLGKDRPDLTTLRAFLASSSQGITYKPGVWHHPLVAMDTPTDFACVVWENGTDGDCEVVDLVSPLVVSVS